MSQEPRARQQEQDAKSQTPDAKCGKINSYQTKMEENQNGTDILKKKRQKPDAKSQMPRARCQSYMAQKSEKSQIQMGHPWNQHLTSRLSLLMIFWCQSEQLIFFENLVSPLPDQ